MQKCGSDFLMGLFFGGGFVLAQGLMQLVAVLIQHGHGG